MDWDMGWVAASNLHALKKCVSGFIVHIVSYLASSIVPHVTSLFFFFFPWMGNRRDASLLVTGMAMHYATHWLIVCKAVGHSRLWLQVRMGRVLPVNPALLHCILYWDSLAGNTKWAPPPLSRRIVGNLYAGNLLDFSTLDSASASTQDSSRASAQ